MAGGGGGGGDAGLLAGLTQGLMAGSHTHTTLHIGNLKVAVAVAVA